MKKIIALISLGMMTLPAFAQKGFYISPTVGIGLGNVNLNRKYNDINGNGILQSGIVSYNGQIGVGYKLKNWRLQTGIQYISTGYKLNGLLFGSQFDPNSPNLTGNGTYQIIYTHIGIPLQVGYAIHPGKKINIVPYIGVLTSYNLTAKSTTIIEDVKTVNNWSAASLDKSHNRISVWGTAAIQLEYKLKERISLVGGPSIQYVVTNFSESPFRHYAINMNAGVNINL